MGVRSPERRVDKVQNGALRGFLGVGIHHPITALETESNWIPARWRVRMKVVLYWRKLLIGPDSVIVKRVINCILANNIKVEWVSKIVSIFDKLKLGDPTDCKSLSSNEFRTVVFSCLKRELHSEWKEIIDSSSKLQDLAGLLSISEASYSTDIRNREVRRPISKIRGGTARLRVEEGNWSRIERSERLYQHCESQEVEDSSHFILRCEKISNEFKRSSLFEELRERVAEFDSKLDSEKLIVALTEACRSTKIGFLILTMWKRRNYVHRIITPWLPPLCIFHLYFISFLLLLCIHAPTLSTLPVSSHSVNHPSLELNNAPPPNLVLVYVTVLEVRPGSLKWQGLNVPRQSGYVPGRTAW